jgi:hypothetical protein
MLVFLVVSFLQVSYKKQDINFPTKCNRVWGLVLSSGKGSWPDALALAGNARPAY